MDWGAYKSYFPITFHSLLFLVRSSYYLDHLYFRSKIIKEKADRKLVVVGHEAMMQSGGSGGNLTELDIIMLHGG